MTDNAELKRLAKAATPGPWSVCGEVDSTQGFEIVQDIWNEHGTHTGMDVVVYEWSYESDPLGVIRRPDADFIAAANPAAVLALIAENERLRESDQEATELCDTLSVLLGEIAVAVRGPEEPKSRHGFHDLPSRVKTVVSERDQLKAENERLESAYRAANAASKSMLTTSVLIERDQFRAEVAGLKTGYEAYERVNAELKAEVEGLESSRAKLAGELSRLRAKHKDWTVDAALGQGEQS
jgi:hypothetical protein